MFEHFPELLEKVNPQEWIEQRNALQAHAFTRTKPMPGALALVRYLVAIILLPCQASEPADVV